MTVWLALLRAVNVGGRNVIPMADMRALMSDMGHDATTHLQSGNVLFAADGSTGDDLAAAISSAINQRFGHEVTVIMRTAEQLRALVASVPFEYPANSSSGVVFCDRPVPADLDTSRFEPDVALPAGDDIWVDIPTGFGKTKLTVAWLEKQTGARGTRRNWKTVKALADKATLLEGSA